MAEIIKDRMDNLTPLSLDHLAIEVRDLDAAYFFYTGILGLKELQTPQEVRSKGVIWLELAHGQALHLVESDATTPPQTAHLAFSVDSIEKWKKLLTENGVQIHPPKFDLYQADRIFFFDPSGNRIEILKWQR